MHWRCFIVGLADGTGRLAAGVSLAKAGLLPKAAVADLDILRQHNPLYFDFALKRLLNWQGHTFSPVVFNTRRLFAASPS